ncbi:MAG TPA: hypothetical protein PLD25_24805 [Chloroflexota bacterium]|nr:hypothetical protein [Chloroflexota bacterium]
MRSRYAGSLLTRVAARTTLSLTYNEPPRSTRYVPVSGPVGLS